VRQNDDTYSVIDKVIVLRDYLVRYRKITPKEAARLAHTGERNARKLLAGMCRVLYMDYVDGYWQLLDEVEDG
jgi:hypothetical protein